MHSIFSSKSIPFVPLLIFISSSHILFGQNLSIKKKSETKEFLQQLVIVYGSDLKKIRGNDTKTLSNTEETVYVDKLKYSIAFEISIDNEKLTFKKPLLSTLYSYPGMSENLERLFKNIELEDTSIPPKTENTALAKKFLDKEITITLNGDEGFIKHYYNQLWRTYRRPNRLSLGVFGGVNFSTTFVSPFLFSDETELKSQTRQENENYLQNWVYGVSLGYSHYSHGVDLFFQHTEYGAKYNQNQSINWSTGYYGGTTSDSAQINIPVNQFGIRYRYSNYYKKVSVYATAGIHISYVSNNRDSLLITNLKSPYNYLSTGCKLGLGVNFHPIYALDIHIAPVMNISFNAVKGTELQTRFSSIALELGLNYNIAFIRKRFTTDK